MDSISMPLRYGLRQGQISTALAVDSSKASKFLKQTASLENKIKRQLSGHSPHPCRQRFQEMYFVQSVD